MENNNVAMCCSLQKKQRENTEEIGTTSSLHHACKMDDHHAGGHPGCLAAPAVMKDKNENSINGTELKMVPPNLCAIKAKQVTIMPEDIQIASPYT